MINHARHHCWLKNESFSLQLHLSKRHILRPTFFQTPIGSHKRVFSHLIPSPEPSPEGGYVGQHSQGLGGHYADSYLKRKRIL